LSQKRLIKQLKQKNPKLNQSQIKFIINFFTKAISKALNDGCGVEIRGLGRWYLKKLKENFNSRNPATNEMIYKPERVKVRFKASKKLNKLINQ
tara:strand:- start:299 stop:580 length:282 start_codon:yes stop_codon:yes gene_type:complete